ncbi:hypothetical protein B7486_02065 [cyanobacterium TDX16]|nr:hypothetical protein B7486_02065 [cyanobacterium TDX16]
MKLMNETPQKLLCIAGVGCPAIYRTDRGTFVIIGKRLDNIPPEIARVLAASPGETVVEVPVELFENLQLPKM